MAKSEKCPTCGERVEQPPNAKRKKIYCNDTCRSVAWHRRKSLAKKKMAEIIKPPAGKRVEVNDLTKPSNGKVKDLTKPPSKSNYAVNTGGSKADRLRQLRGNK